MVRKKVLSTAFILILMLLLMSTKVIAANVDLLTVYSNEIYEMHNISDSTQTINFSGSAENRADFLIYDSNGESTAMLSAEITQYPSGWNIPTGGQCLIQLKTGDKITAQGERDVFRIRKLKTPIFLTKTISQSGETCEFENKSDKTERGILWDNTYDPNYSGWYQQGLSYIMYNSDGSILETADASVFIGVGPFEPGQRIVFTKTNDYSSSEIGGDYITYSDQPYRIYDNGEFSYPPGSNIAPEEETPATPSPPLFPDAPVIYLDPKATTIREGASTTVKWDAVPNAVSYVITVVSMANRETFVYYKTDEITETEYILNELPKGIYLISVYAKDKYSYGSKLNNVIKLRVSNDEYIDAFETWVKKVYSPTVEKGTVRYMCQTSVEAYKNYSPLYHVEYWTKPGREPYTSKGECSTCCISMALSALGLNYTPVDLYNVWGSTKTSFASKFKDTNNIPITYTKGRSLSDFNTMFNNYVSNENFSPIIVYLTKYGNTPHHYVLIVEKSLTNENTYLAVDPYSNHESKVLFEITFAKDANGKDIMKYQDGKKETVERYDTIRFRQYQLKS